MTLPLTAELGDDPDRLLTQEETAKILRLTDRTLRNWAREGIGPRRVALPGRFVRYRAGDVRDWINSQMAVA